LDVVHQSSLSPGTLAAQSFPDFSFSGIFTEITNRGSQSQHPRSVNSTEIGSKWDRNRNRNGLRGEKTVPKEKILPGEKIFFGVKIGVDEDNQQQRRSNETSLSSAFSIEH